MEEVQEGLGFPLTRKWSHPTIETNIHTNSVRLMHVIFDRLHMNVCLAVHVDSLWNTRNKVINDFEVSMIVLAKVSLICFAIVEWHPIDRVMTHEIIWTVTNYFRWPTKPRSTSWHGYERKNIYYLASPSPSLNCQMESLE